MGKDKISLNRLLDLLSDNIDDPDTDKKLRIYTISGNSVDLQGEVYSSASLMLGSLKLCGVDSIDIEYENGYLVLDIYLNLDRGYRYQNNIQDKESDDY